jgi:hypothetical protein
VVFITQLLELLGTRLKEGTRGKESHGPDHTVRGTTFSSDATSYV